MKTTLDIQKELLARARHYAQETGQSLGAVVEEGLRRVLSSEDPNPSYRLPDLSAGNPDDPDPLGAHSWQDLREMIYRPKSD